MSKKHLLLSSALTGSMAFAANGWADQLPADYVKMSGAFGGPYWEIVTGPSFSDGHPRGFLAGGVTYEQPFSGGTNWGVHGELGLTYGENRLNETDHTFTGQGVLYLRDAMMGEIGVYGGVTTFHNSWSQTTTSFGVEGEYYLPRVTLGGALGVQNDNQTHWVAQAGVSLYPTDNLKLTMSALYEERGHAGASFGVEYRPEYGAGFFYIPGTETTLFLNTTYSHQTAAIRAGLRWSWGGSGNSTLLYSDRHERKNFYGTILGSSGISPNDHLPFK